MKIINDIVVEGDRSGRGANVLAFGADDIGVKNSSPALQAALNTSDIVNLPPGVYLLASTVTVPSNKHIYGRGVKIRGAALLIAGSNATIEGVSFVGSAADHGTRGAGGTGLVIDATANRKEINIVNCAFERLGTAISFNGPTIVDPTILLDNISLRGCTFRDLTQHAISFKKGAAARDSNYHVRNLRIADCTFEDIYHTDALSEYDGGIYIAGGVTLEKLIVNGCSVRNCFTTFIACGGNGRLDQATISACHISGEPAADGIATHLMGLDLQCTQGVIVSGCNFEHFQQECLALFWAEDFVVSGCTFGKANIGIGLYAAEGHGCQGVITGCVFADMQDPSGLSSSRYCIVMTEAAHQVTISACQFQDRAGLGMTGIRIEDVVQEIIVSGCIFNGLSRGIMAATGLEWRLTVDACHFYRIGMAAITMQQVYASVLSNCVFDGCAADFVCSGGVSTTSFLRAANNSHIGTVGVCYTIPNANACVFSGNLFLNVGDISAGVNQSGEAWRSVWRDNVLAGSTPAEPHNIGRADYLSADGKRVMHNSAPPSGGAWQRGDFVWNTLPAAGGVAGWVCVSSGSPGIWKAYATIAP